MEATPLQQLSMAILMLLLLVLVMGPKLRATLGPAQAGVDMDNADANRRK